MSAARGEAAQLEAQEGGYQEAAAAAARHLDLERAELEAARRHEQCCAEKVRHIVRAPCISMRIAPIISGTSLNYAVMWLCADANVLVNCRQWSTTSAQPPPSLRIHDVSLCNVLVCRLAKLLGPLRWRWQGRPWPTPEPPRTVRVSWLKRRPRLPRRPSRPMLVPCNGGRMPATVLSWEVRMQPMQLFGFRLLDRHASWCLVASASG